MNFRSYWILGLAAIALTVGALTYSGGASASGVAPVSHALAAVTISDPDPGAIGPATELLRFEAPANGVPVRLNLDLERSAAALASSSVVVELNGQPAAMLRLWKSELTDQVIDLPVDAVRGGVNTIALHPVLDFKDGTGVPINNEVKVLAGSNVTIGAGSGFVGLVDKNFLGVLLAMLLGSSALVLFGAFRADTKERQQRLALVHALSTPAE
jgi:hypothetical protein